MIDLGLCSTPMSYYGNGKLGADASIMITASHNPGEWNGFKLCREKAIPISGATGIQELERIVNAGDFAKPAAVPASDRPITSSPNTSLTSGRSPTSAARFRSPSISPTPWVSTKTRCSTACCENQPACSTRWTARSRTTKPTP